jgi:hypothetical protein
VATQLVASRAVLSSIKLVRSFPPSNRPTKETLLPENKQPMILLRWTILWEITSVILIHCQKLSELVSPVLKLSNASLFMKI